MALVEKLGEKGRIHFDLLQAPAQKRIIAECGRQKSFTPTDCTSVRSGRGMLRRYFEPMLARLSQRFS